ncbi:hypothetical protein D3C75_925290 [compost metagenome]
MGGGFIDIFPVKADFAAQILDDDKGAGIGVKGSVIGDHGPLRPAVIPCRSAEERNPFFLKDRIESGQHQLLTAHQRGGNLEADCVFRAPEFLHTLGYPLHIAQGITAGILQDSGVAFNTLFNSQHQQAFLKRAIPAEAGEGGGA